jgi:hypothetical protein
MILSNQEAHPTLFKASNPLTFEEKMFENLEDAYTWAISHKDWILKKRETIIWNYPLEQTIAKECWVKVG